MRTAFRCSDIVCVRVYGLLIGIVVLQSDLYEAVSLLCSKIDGRYIDGLLMSVEILNERDNSSVIMQMLLNGLFASVICKIDGYFLVEECHLSVSCDH